MASKFWEHFLYIADAMNHRGNEAWDSGTRRMASSTTCSTARRPHVPLKVRSIVGLIPLFAVETLEPDVLEQVARFQDALEWFVENRPDLTENLACMRPEGTGERNCC